MYLPMPSKEVLLSIQKMKYSNPSDYEVVVNYLKTCRDRRLATLLCSDIDKDMQSNRAAVVIMNGILSVFTGCDELSVESDDEHSSKE